jgi:hypothetical protein
MLPSISLKAFASNYGLISYFTIILASTYSTTPLSCKVMLGIVAIFFPFGSNNRLQVKMELIDAA